MSMLSTVTYVPAPCRDACHHTSYRTFLTERGCVVLDQPQHVARLNVPIVPPNASLIAMLLRLGFATAALHCFKLPIWNLKDRAMFTAST